MVISLKDKIISKARRNVLLACLLFFVLLGAVVVFLNRSTVSAASSQIKNPGTVATSSAVGTITWTNPANAKAADSVYASSSITYNATSYYLLATNFGFNIPTGSTINGISARVKRYSGSATYIKDAYVQLIKGGVVQTTNKAVTTGWPTSNTYSATYGGAADLWSGTWTPADINASNFGIAIAAKNTKTTSGTYIAYVDHIELTISYTLPPPDFPTLVYPANATTGVSTLPTLQFGYSDPVGSSCTKYAIQIDDNSDFSSPTVSTTVSGTWSSGSTISYTVSSALNGGTQYYWRVNVYNGTGWSGWLLNLTNIKSIRTGFYHTCALSNAGNIYCWGRNDYGEFGDGSTSSASAPVRVLKGAAVSADNDGTYLTNIKSIGPGGDHTCALSNAGNIYCWGENPDGELGNGSTADAHTPVRVLKGAAVSADNDGTYLTNIGSIDPGYYHTCVLSNAGNTYCWGYNDVGELGNGSTVSASAPVRVLKGAAVSADNDGTYLANLKSIYGGGYYTCALSNAGNTYCWGENGYGQLGNGSTAAAHTPVRVLKGAAVSADNDGTYLTNIGSIDPGDYHTCALSNAGNTYCWGENYYGELGNGSTVSASAPVRVLKGAAVSADNDGTYLANLKSIDAGFCYNCALSNAGNTYCWGYNDTGEIGNDSTAAAHTPVRVLKGAAVSADNDGTYLTNLKSIDAGWHTCALSNVGNTYCWGENNMGQVGNGSTADAHTPVRVLSGAAQPGDIDLPWSFTTAAPQPPNVPALVSPSYGATGVTTTPTLQFSYSDPNNKACTKFTVQIDDNSNFSSPTVSTTVSGSWSSGSTISYAVSTGLAADTDYYWRIRAYNGSAWSGWSDWSDWSGDLTDNFDDNSIDTAKWAAWTNNGATVAESGQQIVITPATGTANSSGYFESQDYYDLTGRGALVNAKQVSSGTTTDTAFMLYKDDDNILQIIHAGGSGNGTLDAYYDVGGTERTIASIPFNAGAMGWWRIREVGGTIYWEYSSDGLLWAELAHLADPFAVTSLQVELIVLEYGANSNAGPAWFDNFNVAQINTLTDNFNDNSMDVSKWNVITAGGSVAETSQQLSITSGTGQWNWNGIESKTLQDFTDSQVSAQLVDGAGGATDGLNFTVSPLEIAIDDDNRIYVYLDNGWLGCNVVEGGSWSDLGGMDYNPSVHKYVKIYNFGGYTGWAWSTDGSTWNDMGSKVLSWGVSAVAFHIYTMPEGSGTTPVQVCNFDDLVASRIINYPWHFATKSNVVFNQPPAITSFSIDASDTTNTCRIESSGTVCRSGATTTFMSTASDPDNDLIKLFVCKDFLCSNCGPNNTSNCWATSSAAAASNPLAAYDSGTRPGSPGEYTTTSLRAYGKVCDSNDACSSVYGVSPSAATWINTLGNSDVWEDSFAIQQTMDGGYAMLGSTDYSGPDTFLLSKLDFSGNVAWSKSISAPPGADADGNSMYQTLDGGYIIGADSQSSTDTDIVLAKLSPNASSVEWAETIGGTSEDTLDSIQQNPDGTYILIATTRSFVSGSAENIFVAKLASDGSRIWAKVIGGTNYEGGHSIQRISGGYIISGETCSYGANCDIFVIKITENGDISWSKTIGTSGGDYAFSIQQTSDGGFILTGGTDAYGNGDVFVAKLTDVGGLSWFKTFGGDGLDQGFTVKQTSPDGGYVVSGFANVFEEGGPGDIFIAKLTSTGVISWSKLIGGDGGNESPGSLNSMQQTSDGGYVIAGYTDDFDMSDALLVKLDSNGDCAGSDVVSSIYLTAYNKTASAASFTPSVNSFVVPTISAKTLSISQIYLGEYDRRY